jgi:hypothetical protein
MNYSNGLVRYQHPGLMVEFLFNDSKEKARVGAVLAKIPIKWRKTILAVFERHFPVLNEFYKPR